MADENFTLIVDFDKDAPKPSRVFKAMADLIESFETFDHSLVKSVDNKIETVLVIEDIEKGSLKTILRNILNKIPDEGLGSLDVKQAVGHYLVKAKYIILKKLEDKVAITDGSNVVEDIEHEIVEEARKSGVNKLPYYSPPSKRAIVDTIASVTQAVEPLAEKDSVVFESSAGKATFNLELQVNPELLEDLITSETIESTAKMILKVKKPDYLGESQWTFKHGDHTLLAKIEHQEWLNAYQAGEIDLRPQDSLSCEVKTTVKYDADFEVVAETHIIVQIFEVHKRKPNTQQKLGGL